MSQAARTERSHCSKIPPMSLPVTSLGLHSVFLYDVSPSALMASESASLRSELLSVNDKEVKWRSELASVS